MGPKTQECIDNAIPEDVREFEAGHSPLGFAIVSGLFIRIAIAAAFQQHFVIVVLVVIVVVSSVAVVLGVAVCADTTIAQSIETKTEDAKAELVFGDNN